MGEQAENQDLLGAKNAFVKESIHSQYSYNFSWLGRPIINYPLDIVAVQELIWKVKPDLIIETGIAHGGSLLLSVSRLALLEYCDAEKNRELLDPANPRRKVLGIDIDIRAHNREAIEAHPLFSRVAMIEGSSIDDSIISKVRDCAKGSEKIMVFLDSNHTHEPVVKELEAYAPLVTKGSYCVVFDTLVEDMPKDTFPDRPWDLGNNPKTAVWEFLKSHKEFIIDKKIENKLLITVAPDGYLKRI